MQQLQSLYRGDSSPSLAQIFGMQYQPQQAISQAANTAVGSGMSAGAQVKTTAMNNATQMAIADANRFQQDRHFKLTNAFQNRQQSEVERHNMSSEANADRVTDWNTGGVVDSEDKKAQGLIDSQVSELEMSMNMLDPNDPKYAEKVAMIKGRIKTIRDGAANAAKTRGGLSGYAGGLSRMYGKDGSFTTQGGKLLTIVPGAKKPAPTATKVAGTSGPKPNEIATDHAYKDSGGTYLPAGTTSLFASSPGVPTLGGSLGVLQGVYGSGSPAGTMSIGMTGSGQPVTGTITQGVAAPAPTTPPVATPAAAPTTFWPAAATGGSTTIAPTTLGPTPAPAGGIVANPIKLPSWFNPGGR